jgi:hypothetical protein
MPMDQAINLFIPGGPRRIHPGPYRKARHSGIRIHVFRFQ